MELTLQIRELLCLALAGDNALAGDPLLERALSEGINDLLHLCEPLNLISADIVNYSPVRYLDARYFLRKPESLEELQEAGLVGALISLTAAHLASPARKGSLIEEGAAEAAEYMAGLFSFLEAEGFCAAADKRSEIPFLLAHYGYEKCCSAKWGGSGVIYSWREGAVQAIDSFMLRGGVLSPSELRAYRSYLSWADNSPLNRADREAALALDNIFLRRMYAKDS
ncbi:MAG: hypothetical protein LBP51_03900 [Deferribacteraceae bacterium]|jgi:hypothetical protein|nr:hypothetical protein [Deferribacteraceae bacterium]